MDLAGQSLVFVTRTGFLSRNRAHRLAVRADARPETGTPRPGSVAVYGLGGTISKIRQGTLLTQHDRLLRRGVHQISEIAFLRAVGLLPNPVRPARLVDAAQFAQLSGLGADTVSVLSLAGAFEPVGAEYPFSDIRLARQIGDLQSQGYDLAVIAEAAATARRHEGSRIDAHDGEITIRLRQTRIDPAGQTVLALESTTPTLPELLDEAEEAEQQDDVERAHRLYEIAAMAAPHDAVIHYNLGCVLTRIGDLDRAEIQFQLAASLDRSFAEASFNAAHVRRLKGDAAGERRFLDQALEADPEYVDAMVCLARWFVRRDAFAEVRALLDRIAAIGIPDEHAEFVRKAKLLCRLAGV